MIKAQTTIETEKFGTLVIAITNDELIYSHVSTPVEIENGHIELLDAPYGLNDSEIDIVLEELEAQL